MAEEIFLVQVADRTFPTADPRAVDGPLDESYYFERGHRLGPILEVFHWLGTDREPGYTTVQFANEFYEPSCPGSPACRHPVLWVNVWQARTGTDVVIGKELFILLEPPAPVFRSADMPNIENFPVFLKLLSRSRFRKGSRALNPCF